MIDTKQWTGTVHQGADGLAWHNHYSLDRTLALTAHRLRRKPGGRGDVTQSVTVSERSRSILDDRSAAAAMQTMLALVDDTGRTARGDAAGQTGHLGSLAVGRRRDGHVDCLSHPGDLLGLAAVGLLLGPAFFGQDYAWYALVHKRGSLPGGLAMAWLGLWPWYVVLGLLSFVLLLFPSGQLASPRWRPVAWVAATATAAMGLSAAFKPRPLEGFGLDGLTNPARHPERRNHLQGP